ncbi:glycosyltransferase [Crocinitomicaceae bacterium]|nr:glycosyltransferase [Crocinitomicaceae bacterium]
MRISVIIPAYNAEKYIEKAVKSVLYHENVNELIIVEDGSKDRTLNICNNLQKIDKRILIHTHPENQNLGAGASRNLGIQKSTCEYLAFLDADDYYLPNRFDTEKLIFKSQKHIDGVYGALGTHYYSQSANLKYKRQSNNDLTTVKCLSPDCSAFIGFLGMSKKWTGYFSIDTFTIKRESLSKLEYLFNPELKLHQDTEFIIRFLYYNEVIAGIVDKPIAIRGVHDYNRILSNRNESEHLKKYYSSLLKWYTSQKTKNLVLNKLKGELKYHDFFSKKSKVNIARLLIFICSDRVLFFNDRYLQLGAQKVKNGEKLLNLIIRLKEKFIISFLKQKKKKYSVYID